jgi:hypothetical protein
MAPMMYDYGVMKKGFYGHYVLFEQVADQASCAQPCRWGSPQSRR